MATSRLAATMSAYLVTDQKPEPSSADQATGASRRSRPNSAYGTARAHMSRSVRSTALTAMDQIVWHQTNKLRNGAGRLTAMRVLVIRHHDVDSAGFIADGLRGARRRAGRPPVPRRRPAARVRRRGSHRGDRRGQLGQRPGPPGSPRSWPGSARPTRRACPCSASASAPRSSAPRSAAGSRPWAAMRSAGAWWTRLDPDVVPAGPWLEFHGDRCLPPAAGARCWPATRSAVQAFRIGRHLAVQFHPEVDGPQLKRWLDAGGDADAERAGHGPGPVPGRHHPRRSRPRGPARTGWSPPRWPSGTASALAIPGMTGVRRSTMTDNPRQPPSTLSVGSMSRWSCSTGPMRHRPVGMGRAVGADRR